MAKLIKKIKRAKSNAKVTRERNITTKRNIRLRKSAASRLSGSSGKKTPSAEDMVLPLDKLSAGPQEKLRVEEAKYSTPAEFQPRPKLSLRELPQKYDRDVAVLQVRDPWWLHAYWEVCDATYTRLRNELGALFDSGKKVLRVYDVSFINFNGSNAHRFFDIEVTHSSDNWYIDTGGPGRSWCVDFGLKLPDGRFITIVRSNVVTTPLDGPSWITDEEWMIPDDLFARIYGTAVGLGGSPVRLKKPWLELKKRQFASGGISSVGMSPVKKRMAKRQFWLVVNAELIVYGTTESKAKLTACGKPVNLRPDGTFSLRFSLPDGKQFIPVKATSFDGLEKRAVTVQVTRETL